MALTYKTNLGSTEYKLVPEGTHIMICYIVADLGLQPGSQVYPAPKQKVCLVFEVPAERDDDGRPLSIRMEFTASMHEKSNLRKQLVSWRGKPFTDEEAGSFNVASVLGAACMGAVVHTPGDKTYANIKSIMGLPKGTPKPKAENELVLFENDPKATNFAKLPEWLQKKIDNQIKAKNESETPDWNYEPISDSDLPANMQEDDSDSVPF